MAASSLTTEEVDWHQHMYSVCNTPTFGCVCIYVRISGSCTALICRYSEISFY